MTSEAQAIQPIPTLTKEDGMEHILRMSLQFILNTITYINLQKLAWSHCLVYGKYSFPYLQNIFSQYFPDCFNEYKGTTYFTFSCKNLALYVNDEQQTAEGYLSTGEYFLFLCKGLLPY